jgi:Domain of unknown function (DUF4397)
MKRQPKFVLLGLATAALSGACRETTNHPRGVASPAPADISASAAERDTSLVRVVHAIPGGAPADVYAGDEKAFSGVEYKTVTPYAGIEDNHVTFRLRAAGQLGEPLAENRELLLDGNQYTIVAMPGERGEAAELKVLKDEQVSPAEGKAKLRVVNASADSGELEILLDGRKDPLVGSLEAADDRGYREVEPATGKLIVRDKDKGRVVAEASNANLSPGRAYTMLVVGRTAGSPRAEVIVIEDGLAPTRMGSGARPAMPPS